MVRVYPEQIHLNTNQALTLALEVGADTTANAVRFTRDRRSHGITRQLR